MSVNYWFVLVILINLVYSTWTLVISNRYLIDTNRYILETDIIDKKIG